MGEIFIGGMTEFPFVRYKDPDAMAQMLRARLGSHELPEQFREPKNWPESMQVEWSSDEGHAVAVQHRARLIDGFRAVRAELNEFKPDAVLVINEEHFENFHEDVLPALCIYAADNHIVEPHQLRGRSVAGSEWDEPDDTRWTVPGNRHAARYLARALLDDGFDLAIAYEGLHLDHLAHTFTGVVNYLDWDRQGLSFPIIPLHLNCYGEKYVPAALKLNQNGELEDIGPPRPARCFQLGEALARIILSSPWRIAILGGSSWSHGNLTAKHGSLFPDQEADIRLYEALKSSDFEVWRSMTLDEIVDNGQLELLTWFPIVGALSVIEPRRRYLEFVGSYLFNSDKVFAAYAN